MADNVDLEACPRRCATREFVEEGEILLYLSARDEATLLNQTAAEVWRLCDGQTSQAEIITQLSRRYGVDSALIQEDILTTLQELLARDLIEVLQR